jgi:hypothetical protein
MIISNSYLNDRKAVDRLKREYQEHKNLIIGFDFDNTIYDYHKEGLELQPVIDLLKRCSDLGFTMCLYSASLCEDEEKHDKQMFEKKGFCEYSLGIKVECINYSPIPVFRSYKDKKPYFSILLDDRAGLSSAYSILKTTLNELEL